MSLNSNCTIEDHVSPTGWVRCKDRLPEKEMDCFIHIEGVYGCRGGLNQTHWYYPERGWNLETGCIVTHWAEIQGPEAVANDDSGD